MVRRTWLLPQIALLGVLAALALPSSSSALSAAFIALTPTGPSPAVLTIPAFMYPVWQNQDSVAHTVTFANGKCSVQIAPGAIGQCTNGFANGVGDYAYTVDGTVQASIVVAAVGRSVSLGAKTHAIYRGSSVRLHGRLRVQTGSPPALEGPRQSVTVLARPDRHHPFHRIRVVTAKPHRSESPGDAYSVWQLHVRPGRNKIYIAEANSQPKGGQVWEPAHSRPFRVRVIKR
jgi:hypothetical protein